MNAASASLVTAALLLGPLASAQTAPAAAPQSTTSQPPQTQTPQAQTVSEVVFVGFTVFEAAQLREALAGRVGVGAGQAATPAQLEDARSRLAASYPEVGFPFSPQVKLSTEATPQGLRVTFTADESAPISRVEVTGAASLSAAQVSTLFKSLADARRVTPASYEATLTALAKAYSDAGLAFRTEDVRARLEGTVLKVSVTEPLVAAVDLSALGEGVSAGALRTRGGQVLNTDAVNDDTRTLSNLLGRPVTWGAAPDAAGRLTVTFRPLESATAERVRQIEVSGNRSVSAADIAKVLRLQPGDVASPQLAQQDYYAIQKLYDSRGLVLVPSDDSLSFENGVLTFRLREAQIAGYVLNWQGDKPLLREDVALRQLPAVGSVFTRDSLRAGLFSLQSFDNVQITGQSSRALDPANPERLTFVLDLGPRPRSVPISADVSYAPQEGLGASVGYGTNNFLGTGNGLSVTFGAGGSDVNDRFSGSVNYTVPWIQADFLDFRARPTSLSLGAWSNVSGNNTLLIKGEDGVATAEDTGRQYSVRSTGASVGLGRDLSRNVSATAGVSVAQRRLTLEPYKAGDSAAVTGENRTTYQDDAAARAELPADSTTALTTLGLRFDNPNGAVPTFGARLNTTLGYGFGLQDGGTTRLSWGQIEAGGSAYQGFGRTLEDGTRQDVLAARVNAGTIVGQGGESNLFRVGGGSPNPAYELRGLPNTAYGTSYLTTSAEVRHNFGVKLGGVVQGIYGLAFVDAGDAWTPGNNANNFGLNVGYGVGAQVNTSLLNVQFAYGLNSSGSGKFTLRLGNFW
ncbi:outer membrane protein insertion porin family [Deinococcus reticulitermitis]|uniref:Outer membrane protein insertion porin family n=1 Tax=Deinococcus reticulitermitis TaxID=856736 RepID=A0A1H7BJQ4_9DEIO|nr:BamA/TamA family outer membrane protein [Deinococcus reticulitermitis]SEJ74772.1 outer membrane protein insertion porin family [Deinococcus reticulitermitis]